MWEIPLLNLHPQLVISEVNNQQNNKNNKQKFGEENITEQKRIEKLAKC